MSLGGMEHVNRKKKNGVYTSISSVALVSGTVSIFECTNVEIERNYDCSGIRSSIDAAESYRYVFYRIMLGEYLNLQKRAIVL